MKNVTRVECRRARGFTLVELLVVIGIIAILIAILFPAMRAALKRGEIAKARMDMSHIASAIEAYHKEYGIWPVPEQNGQPDHTFGGKSNPQGKDMNMIMDILRAIPKSPHNTAGTNNVKKIVFLEIPPSSMVGTDIVNGGSPQSYVEEEGYFLDPWGDPYVITMDTDFDGELGIDNLEQTTKAAADLQAMPSTKPGQPNGGVVVGVGVGVMSYGPDPTSRGSFLTSWSSK